MGNIDEGGDSFAPEEISPKRRNQAASNIATPNPQERHPLIARVRRFGAHEINRRYAIGGRMAAIDLYIGTYFWKTHVTTTGGRDLVRKRLGYRFS